MPTYGPDAIHELIEESGLSYPVSNRQLEQEHALTNVTIDAEGNSVTLAELFSNVEADRYEDRQDLVAKLGPVCEAESERRQVGIIGKFKRTFFGQ